MRLQSTLAGHTSEYPSQRRVLGSKKLIPEARVNTLDFTNFRTRYLAQLQPSFKRFNDIGNFIATLLMLHWVTTVVRSKAHAL
jgi:hypothetical protein